jgi:hypothetical protein
MSDLMPPPAEPPAGPYAAEAYAVVAPQCERPIAVVDVDRRLSDEMAAGITHLFAASWYLLAACREARRLLVSRNAPATTIDLLDGAIAAAEGRASQLSGEDGQ